MAVVYGIRAKDSDQYFYVGCTVKPAQERLKQHMSGVRYDMHANTHFARKVKKVGAPNVALDVLEETEDGQQFEREAWWIQHLLGQGVKLTNIIHNGRDVMIGGASKYSLRNNWEWAKAWYADFQRGYALRSERPECDSMMLEAQRTLAQIIGEILAAPPDEQQRMIARFE